MFVSVFSIIARQFLFLSCPAKRLFSSLPYVFEYTCTMNVFFYRLSYRVNSRLFPVVLKFFLEQLAQNVCWFLYKINLLKLLEMSFIKWIGLYKLSFWVIVILSKCLYQFEISWHRYSTRFDLY